MRRGNGGPTNPSTYRLQPIEPARLRLLRGGCLENTSALFSFYGRMKRSMYWVGMGVVYAMFFLTMIVWSNFQSDYTVSFIVGLWMLLWLSSIFAIASKRLHDLSFPAWWLLVAVVVGFLATLSRVALAEQISSVVFGTGLILLGCFKGASGLNRFGDEPI